MACNGCVMLNPAIESCGCIFGKIIAEPSVERFLRCIIRYYRTLDQLRQDLEDMYGKYGSDFLVGYLKEFETVSSSFYLSLKRAIEKREVMQRRIESVQKKISDLDLNCVNCRKEIDNLKRFIKSVESVEKDDAVEKDESGKDDAV